MKKLTINTRHVRIEGGEAWAIGNRTMSFYIKFTSGKVERTREVVPDVFADFNRHGDIVGMEFLRPGEFDIDAIKTVTEKHHLPSPETIKSILADVRVEKVEEEEVAAS